jgi:hypothetical protein
MAYTGARRPTRDACCRALIALCHSRRERLKATESIRRLSHTVALDMKAVNIRFKQPIFRLPEQVSPARGFCVEVVLEASDAVSESREKQVIVRRSRARRIVLRRHEEVRRQRAVFVLCEQRPRFVEWYHCRHGGGVSASRARWYRRYRSVISDRIF